MAHFTNAAGCDSTATLQLSVKVPSSTLIASICEGESYVFNGQTYTNSGTYIAHLTTATGCDSLANLILQVNLPSTSNSVASICEGETYMLGAVAYNKTGNYTTHLINKEGCDSIANLQLTVYQPKQVSISEEMCDGQVRSFGSQSLTGTGIYYNHFLTTYGCDSAVTLNLTVKPTYLIYRNKSMLYGETDTINGNIYDREGVYRDVFVAANGCDSTIVSSIKIVRSLCPKIIVPPFFTPNGDGNNDFLEIENINCYLRSRVNIFDRYGKLLVNYSGLDLGWDGRYLGNPMPSTDYWYEIILPETGERFVGHFILKR